MLFERSVGRYRELVTRECNGHIGVKLIHAEDESQGGNPTGLESPIANSKESQARSAEPIATADEGGNAPPTMGTGGCIGRWVFE